MTSYDRRHHACRIIIRPLNRSQCSVTLKVHWLNLFAKFSVTERTADALWDRCLYFIFTLCAKLNSAVYCNQSCLCVCWVCDCVRVCVVLIKMLIYDLCAVLVLVVVLHTGLIISNIIYVISICLMVCLVL